jgi:nitronate monooxygenase
VEAGADGLVILTAGAGGHTGWLSPFAFVPAVREFFDGPIVLAGGIMDGAGIRAAEVMGADFAYLGTRFIATPESLASEAYRKLLVEATEEDIVLSSGLTGIPANFIRQSILAAGLDPKVLASQNGHDFSAEAKGPAWKEIWSAGHGVRAIKAVEPIADIVARLRAEYVAAHARP